MSTDNIKNKPFTEDSKEFFSNLQVSWVKPKEEVWKNLAAQIKDPKVIQMRPKIKYWQMAIAASVVLVLSLGFFMRTYTVNFKALTGQHKHTQLPDGSLISLNAESEISYQPYWWWRNRHVVLNGEAYFEVKKGKSFRVESTLGHIEVLGTSFNVFSRGERYEVTCVTGKIKVDAASTKHSVILHPEEKASLQRTGQFNVEESVNIENSKAWISNKMVFTSVLLNEVFEEIERQYNVTIIWSGDLSQRYTGSFENSGSVEDILNLVCRPFELKIKKKDNNKFQILQ